MPFIIGTTAQTLSQAWDDAQSLAVSLHSLAQDQKSASLAGPVTATRILDFEQQLRSYRDRFNAISAMSGIAAYVASLPNTPQGYDVSAAFNAMMTQLLATIQWIRTNFPKDSTNTYLLERSWGADGPVDRTFDTATLASYRTQLDALITAVG